MEEEKGRRIQPRLKTPAPGTGGHLITTRLPDDLLEMQVRRFAVFTAVGVGLWSFGLVVDHIVVPYAVGIQPPAGLWVIETAGVVTAAVGFLYTRYAKRAARRKTNAALLYMLVNAAAVAALNVTHRPPDYLQMAPLSWNTIVILVSSMMIATTPSKMLVAALAAASMDPLAFGIAHLRGVPVPTGFAALVLFMPNYACAVVATVPAVTFNRVGRRLREAEELGSYQLVELLGRGGMGEVWRAKHRLLARDAAIKLVRPELLGAGNATEATTMLRRFEREVQATAALSSPHTVRVFDFGATVDGTFYYVMELLAGRDLESLVREFGPAPAGRTVYLLRQVCHSLADAHARGLVHRDIKPANIYVCRMGLDYDFVKVLDFGLVKVNDPGSALHTTDTAQHVTTGTPAFMAPEVILGQTDVDRRADVYSLGCVAYYLLTGQLVFEADTAMKMLLQHVQTPPIAPSKRTELPISRELDDLVLACLEKNPDRRPQDAAELLEMIGKLRHVDAWDGEAAKRWWEQHLVELTGPQSVVEPFAESDARPLVTQ